MLRPVIGVTGPEKRLLPAWWAARLCIGLCGGVAVYMTPQRLIGTGNLDAVIIGGGDDIDPQLYGSEDKGLARIDRERDAFEAGIIEGALNSDLPIFGICRGMQLLNVVLGGSLHGDIRAMRHKTSNRRSPLPQKWVRLEGDARIRAIINNEQFRVNSLHHQAIDRLGDGMRAVAWDQDHFVQAIEYSEHRFLMGVQWHPEYLPYLGHQMRLFKAVVQAARLHLRSRQLC